MERIPVIAAVSLVDIAVSVREIPLSARIAGIVAGRRRRIQPDLAQHARANMVIVKISTNAQMRKANFVRTKYFARTADRIVLGTIEVVMVGHVRSNLGRE